MFCRYPVNVCLQRFKKNFAVYCASCVPVAVGGGVLCMQAIDSADTGEGPDGVILPVLHGDEGDVDETLFYGTKVTFIFF